MGADSAIEIIQNCTHKDYTEVGNSLDATSLDNMLAAIPYMKSINEYRKSVGLSELQVTYKLIAAAIANANYSDVKFGHSMQFDTTENLAWNYGTDPKPQWVDQEKAFFDQAVQELYGVTGLTGKDAVDFYKTHSGIESYVNQHFKVAGYPATRRSLPACHQPRNRLYGHGSLQQGNLEPAGQTRQPRYRKPSFSISLLDLARSFLSDRDSLSHQVSLCLDTSRVYAGSPRSSGKTSGHIRKTPRRAQPIRSRNTRCRPRGLHLRLSSKRSLW